MKYLLPFLLGFTLMIAFHGTVRGHSWYPQSCCSGKDCAPIASERVKVTPEGYVIDGRHHIPHRQVKWSPDENYHACFPPNLNALGCFWAPQTAM